MRHNLIETVVGAVVLLVAAGFAWFAVASSGVRNSEGYEIVANFDRVGGITAGSDVRVSGIKVGTVSAIRLDPKTYLAEVRLRLPSSIQLPVDSVAQITSDGLLGSNFLSIVPGGADETLKHDQRLRYTQAPVDLMQMLGRFIFSVGEQQQGQAGAPPQPPKGQAAEGTQAFPGAPIKP